VSVLGAFLADRRGASAAEFALVLPLVLLLLFGIIDAGRYAWLLNRLEKGAQEGVRYAVVTDIVPAGLNTYNTVGLNCNGTVLRPSDRICAEALGTITCTASGCHCAQAPCPVLGAPNTTAFQNIASRIARFAPVDPADVAVSYSGSGIGFAGDPALNDAGAPLSDIAPLVTVAINGVELRAMLLFGGAVDMPEVASSLVLEDGTGTAGY
jgi:Flp pilus assembly pilin Flp